MSEYLVSARKYRPKNFKDVVGQEHITTTLENAIKTNQISHAYIFCGPRGVGKTSCARIFANKINNIDLENNADSSFNIFELDAASNNSVDDIRDLVNQTRIAPQVGKYKVYIIDEVHMLSKNAFNAFLKTLEEPPKYCVFILATTEKQKLIPTILSRCQIFEFHRINSEKIYNHLLSIVKKEKITVENESIRLISDTADGALRDALSTFDKIIGFCGNNWKHEEVEKILNSLNPQKVILFIEKILNKNIPECLVEFNTILESGFEGKDLIISLTEYFRSIMLCKNPISFQILPHEGELKGKLETIAKQISTENILIMLDILSDCQQNYNNTFNQRFLVELCLMKLCSLENSIKKKTLITPPNREKVTSTQKKEIISIKENNTIETEKENNTIETEKEHNTIETEKETDTIETEKETSSELTSSILGGTIEDCLNLKESTLNTKPEIIKNNTSEIVRQSFSEETLKPIWENLCEHFKQQQKINLYSTLKNQKNKKFENGNLILTVNSEAQKKEIIENQNSLLSFLKKELKIEFIKLNISLNAIEKEDILYTTEDKLKYLIKEKPELIQLMKNLELEIKN